MRQGRADLGAPAEAQAILLAPHGVQMPRPMTHDLMASLLGGICSCGDSLLDIFGLVSSTALNMLVVPADYFSLYARRVASPDA